MIKRISDPRNLKVRLRTIFNHLFVSAQDPQYVKYILGAVTLFGVIMRLYIINDPVGYDEAYTFIYFSSKPAKFILADYHAPNNHILNSLLVGLAYRILGNYIWIVRLPAFVAGVLAIPVAFIAARRYFTAPQALAASSVLAVAPNIVAASANGRGYTLIILFSLLLVNFAGILNRKQSKSALAAYAITGALGFYSIPIFLYPMAGISLWVVLIYLKADHPRRKKWRYIRNFLLACTFSGTLTLALYSPVILFGTGFDSIVANDIVKSQSWVEFGDNLLTRSTLTWQSWIAPYTPPVRYIHLAGFLLSVLFYKKVSNQELPIQISLLAGAALVLALQRVMPLPRIWGYLEMFFLFFSAAGIVGFGQLILRSIHDERTEHAILSVIILLSVIVALASVTMKTQNREARLNRTIAPEKFAADFLAEHLTENDTIIAVAPTDIQTAYYLKINGVPYDFFYQRDHPVEIQSALVLVRTRGEYGFDTLEKVIDFYSLTTSLDTTSALLVFDYGPLFIYSIPAKR